MTALFALAPAPGLARQNSQDAAYAEAALAVRRRRRPERPHRWHGTTLTALLVSGGRAALVRTGDSRAVRRRGGQLRPITEDYTISNLVATSS